MRPADLECTDRLDVLRLEPRRLVPRDERRAQRYAADAVRRCADLIERDQACGVGH